MPSRRQLLSVVAASPALAALAPLSSISPSRESRAAASDDVGAPEVAPPRLAGAAGPVPELELAGGFRIVRTSEPLFGALPFVIEGEGERFQVDVLRRHAALEGAFDTEHLSLFVVGGATVLTTPTRVRGARALGAALERRYATTPALASLSTFAEREASHPGAALAIDVA